MGINLRVLNESFPMNINMTGFRKLKNLCVLVLLTKVDSALEGIRMNLRHMPVEIKMV